MAEGKIRILLVEDNPGDVRLIQEMFKQAEVSKYYELSVAETLDSALARLQKEAFGGVLLDLNLPDSHGIATLKSIQGSATEIAVVVITGLNDDTIVIESIKMGTEDFLRKGKIDSSIIVRSLRYAIERKSRENTLKKMLKWQTELAQVQQSLLSVDTLENKLKKITDEVVRIFNADFCRIWLIRPGDRCNSRCVHAKNTEGPHVCTHRDKCLHLISSSGRYTHTDGEVHCRVPYDCYKIGRIASGKDFGFLTNDVPNDPRVHNHEWARNLGLVSFAGYRISIPNGETLGVVALFAKHIIEPDETSMLESISSTAAFVIQQTTAESFLHESEEKYRTIFENSKDALMTLTPPSWGFTLCNQSTITMFKMKSKKEFLGCEPWKLSPEKQPDGRASKEKATKMIELALREGSNFFEWTHKRANGEEFFATVFLTRLEHAGIQYIHATIKDITQHKNEEKTIQNYREHLEELVKNRTAELEITKDLAQEANKTKSLFLANMSHELRTPLNSINGFSEVLYDETFGPLNEKQKKYVNNILTSGKHLLLLINQILDMAKVEAGKMKLALSNLSTKNLLNEISLLVEDMASKKKLYMLLEIAEDLPDIEADELKVKEIIYNLLSNAVKFTPEDGKLGMRARKSGSDIEIVVWDTGIGIAPKNMEKIFEGFFRVDTPYSRVTEGTGLGLPLSRKLVELHGGKFSVKSEGLNKGTEVKFTLPIISKKEV